MPRRECEMAEYKAGKRERVPTHPGAIVKSAIDALRVSARQAALAMGTTPQALGNVLAQKSAVTAEMALRIAAYIGNGPNGAELLLSMQNDYDLWHARITLKGALSKIKEADRV